MVVVVRGLRAKMLTVTGRTPSFPHLQSRRRSHGGWAGPCPALPCTASFDFCERIFICVSAVCLWHWWMRGRADRSHPEHHWDCSTVGGTWLAPLMFWF